MPQETIPPVTSNNHPNSNDFKSPLEEADPNSLDELFLRLSNNQIKLMPKEILEKDFDKKIKDLRSQRLDFTLKYELFLKEKAFSKKNGTPGPNSNSKSAMIQRLKNVELDF